MRLQRRFFTTFFFIIGFFCVPVILTTFFLTLQATNPSFWTKGISAAGFISGYVEDNFENSRSVEKNKKIPMAVQRNLKIAKDSIAESVDKHMLSQIEQQLVVFKAYIRGEGYFPSFIFKLARLKEDIENNIRSAAAKQKFSDAMVVNLALRILPSVPDRFVLSDHVKIVKIRDFTEKNKTWLSFTLHYPYLFPGVVVVFFFLFLLSNLNIRNALFYFSNLMIFSGLALALICGLGFLALQFFDPYINKWLLNHSLAYYSLYEVNPHRVVEGLTRYIVSAVCYNGLIAAGCSVVVGVLFFAKKKSNTAIIRQPQG